MLKNAQLIGSWQRRERATSPAPFPSSSYHASLRQRMSIAVGVCVWGERGAAAGGHINLIWFIKSAWEREAGKPSGQATTTTTMTNPPCPPPPLYSCTTLLPHPHPHHTHTQPLLEATANGTWDNATWDLFSSLLCQDPREGPLSPFCLPYLARPLFVLKFKTKIFKWKIFV